MGEKLWKNELFQASQGMILISYSVFTIILSIESILMQWEEWVIPLLFIGLAVSWWIHLARVMTQGARLWVYSVLMMVVFFFYGSHVTSTFDLAPVMIVVIMIYTMTGTESMIYLGTFTYYLTMFYSLSLQIRADVKMDTLFVSRTLLHFGLVFMAAWISLVVTRKWGEVLFRSDDKIKELSEATGRMNDFLANVSHEIRTPINAVIGLSEVSLRKETDPVLQKNLHSIKDAGNRVTEQISDILDYTEIDMNHLVINEESYMLSSLINDLAERTHLLDRPEIEIIFDVDAKVPAVMVGDANKIKKIIWHLIQNGVKFTKKGGVYVKIFSHARPYGVNLAIEVTDTGIGMEEEEIDRIFEKFYQADSGRSRTVGGLGLGIPIVYGFIKQMGGFLSIKSNPGEGTTALVSIPQKVENPESCMQVEGREKVCLATFLQYADFDVPKVREFYNEMIRNLSDGLGVALHPTTKLEGLENLLQIYQITHLFVGAGEYEKHTEFIESLTKEMEVIIVADDSFTPVPYSKVKFMRKPFYCFPVASILSSNPKKKKDPDAEAVYCPDVRALVVDDESMNLLVAEGILKGYGMTVATVSSGQQAIDICEDTSFDIIFMDHMMPEMDGIEAMKRLRSQAVKKNHEYCIVALTANTASSAKNMFLSEGFDGFIPKPIETSELERVLRRVLPKSAFAEYPAGEKNTQSEAADGMQTPENSGPLDAQDERERISDLLEAAGVETAKGLRYCQDDFDFYLTVLAQFANDHSEKTRKLSDAYVEKNWSDYAIVVHALKSTAKMIGAMEFSEQAKRLEDAAKSERESVIKKYHDPLLVQYEALSQLLISVCGSGQEEGPEVMEFWEGEEMK